MSEITQEGNIIANEAARDPAGLVGTNHIMYYLKKTGREGPGANFLSTFNRAIGRQFAGFKRSPFLNNKVITPEHKEMGKCPSLKRKIQNRQ